MAPIISATIVTAPMTFGESSIEDRLGMVMVIDASESTSGTISSATRVVAPSSARTPSVQGSSSSSSRISAGVSSSRMIVSTTSGSTARTSSGAGGSSISASMISASKTSASSTSGSESSSIAGSESGIPPPPASTRANRRSIASPLPSSEVGNFLLGSAIGEELSSPSNRSISSVLFPDTKSPFSLQSSRSSDTFIADSESRSRHIPPAHRTLGSLAAGLSTPSAFRFAERGYARVRETAETV